MESKHQVWMAAVIGLAVVAVLIVAAAWTNVNADNNNERDKIRVESCADYDDPVSCLAVIDS